MIERGISRIACGVAESLGARAEVRYRRIFPALINSPGSVQIAARAAAAVVGSDNVNDTIEPIMGSEDSWPRQLSWAYQGAETRNKPGDDVAAR
jgi:metal-dependent amidase/aminoacylase/carboxypeptidase family protein